MPDKRFGLHFYLKKLKSYWKGILPTYLRITVDGIPKELSTKRDYDLTRWNSEGERASGTKEEIRALNTYIDTLQAKVYVAKGQLIEGNKVISALTIKEMLFGNNQHDKMLIEIFTDYNGNVKKLIDKAYSKATREKYGRTCRFAQSFIKIKYKFNDFPIQSLNPGVGQSIRNLVENGAEWQAECNHEVYQHIVFTYAVLQSVLLLQ